MQKLEGQGGNVALADYDMFFSILTLYQIVTDERTYAQTFRRRLGPHFAMRRAVTSATCFATTFLFS